MKTPLLIFFLCMPLVVLSMSEKTPLLNDAKDVRAPAELSAGGSIPRRSSHLDLTVHGRSGGGMRRSGSAVDLRVNAGDGDVSITFRTDEEEVEIQLSDLIVRRDGVQQQINRQLMGDAVGSDDAGFSSLSLLREKKDELNREIATRVGISLVSGVEKEEPRQSMLSWIANNKLKVVVGAGCTILTTFNIYALWQMRGACTDAESGLRHDVHALPDAVAGGVMKAIKGGVEEYGPTLVQLWRAEVSSIVEKYCGGGA